MKNFEETFTFNLTKYLIEKFTHKNFNYGVLTSHARKQQLRTKFAPMLVLKKIFKYSLYLINYFKFNRKNSLNERIVVGSLQNFHRKEFDILLFNASLPTREEAIQ
jgi:hypothetical protein